MEKTLTLKRVIGKLYRANDLKDVLAAAEGMCKPSLVWVLTWPRNAERQTLVTLSGNEPVDLLIASQIEQIQLPSSGRPPCQAMCESGERIINVLAGQVPLIAETEDLDVVYHDKVPVAVVGIAGSRHGGELSVRDIARAIEHVTMVEASRREVTIFSRLLTRCGENLLVSFEDGRIFAGNEAARRLLHIAAFGSPRSPYKPQEDALPTSIRSLILVGLPASSNKVEFTASPFREVGTSDLLEPLVLVSLRTVESTGLGISPEKLAKLTPTQTEVFRCLIRGDRNKGIAAQLGISPYTARNHVSVVLQVLGCCDRLELIARYKRFNEAPDETKHVVQALPTAPFVADLPLPIMAKRN